ncbi:MAG: hypothetical protein QF614_06580, partial [SAR324 cluster bacterium]|nr:hypothetical protein [SAR324 cluster bacterium]
MTKVVLQCPGAYPRTSAKRNANGIANRFNGDADNRILEIALDGKADVLVVGVDKDRDGIPDALETPAAPDAPPAAPGGGKKGPPPKGKGKGPPKGGASPDAAAPTEAPLAAAAVDVDGDG